MGASGLPIVILAVLPLALRPAAAAEFVPPPGDGLVDVKADCGARGDGTSDDTEALREAFESGKARPGKHGAARAIWLPAGTYLVREPIRVGDKKKFIVGQDRARTVIRLADRSPAFADAARPTPVIGFGKGSRSDWHFAQNFDQRLLNLTIEIGEGNPGAVGVLYHTNNSGGMHGVTIRSRDRERRGACGLLLSDRPGPGLVWDVAVEGFDVGCRIDGDLHGMTLGRLSLSGQRACGFRADGNFSAVWGLASENRVPAVVAAAGHLVLLDARCSGGAPDRAAVEIHGGMGFCRNLEVRGYGTALRRGSGDAGGVELPGPVVEEHVWPRAFSLFGEEPISLDLPVEEPPVEMGWGAPAERSVIRPGPDSAARIQEAIDGDARVIYLLNADGHELRDTIRLRGKVRKIVGAGATFRSKGSDLAAGTKPLFRVEDGEAEAVSIEFISDSYGEASWHIDHASTRTLVCRSTGALSYRNTVTGGKAFFLDAGPGPGTVIRGPQRIWAWQTNTESYEHQPHILNDGGTLFICGYKIEKDRTNVGTSGGGFTEVLGGLLYKNRQRGDMVPAFTNRDSNVTISIGHYGVKYDSLVEEIRAGATRNLTPAVLGGQWVPLYSGWTKRPAAAREPRE